MQMTFLAVDGSKRKSFLPRYKGWKILWRSCEFAPKQPNCSMIQKVGALLIFPTFSLISPEWLVLRILGDWSSLSCCEFARVVLLDEIVFLRGLQFSWNFYITPLMPKIVTHNNKQGKASAPSPPSATLIQVPNEKPHLFVSYSAPCTPNKILYHFLTC